MVGCYGSGAEDKHFENKLINRPDDECFECGVCSKIFHEDKNTGEDVCEKCDEKSGGECEGWI